MSDVFEQLGVGPKGSIRGGRSSTRTPAASTPCARRSETRRREPIIAMIRSRCLGLAELANGEIEAANVHLSEAMDELERVDFREPAIWRVDGDAIEAALGVGELDRAERLVVSFETGRALAHSVEPCGVRPLPRAPLGGAGDLDAAAGRWSARRRTRELTGAVRARADAARAGAGSAAAEAEAHGARIARAGAGGLRELGAEAWVARAGRQSSAGSRFGRRHSISARPSCASHGSLPTGSRTRRSPPRCSSRARRSRRTWPARTGSSPSARGRSSPARSTRGRAHPSTTDALARLVIAPRPVRGSRVAGGACPRRVSPRS